MAPFNSPTGQILKTIVEFERLSDKCFVKDAYYSKSNADYVLDVESCLNKNVTSEKCNNYPEAIRRTIYVIFKDPRFQGLVSEIPSLNKYCINSSHAEVNEKFIYATTFDVDLYKMGKLSEERLPVVLKFMRSGESHSNAPPFQGNIYAISVCRSRLERVGQELDGKLVSVRKPAWGAEMFWILYCGDAEARIPQFGKLSNLLEIQFEKGQSHGN